MSDDLVKRWDDYVESMGCVMGEVEHMAQQMRDRIEELEKDVRKWQAKHDTWRAMALSAETKLEVAVRSLDEIAGKKTYADDPWGIARTTLAELKGQENE